MKITIIIIITIIISLISIILSIIVFLRKTMKDLTITNTLRINENLIVEKNLEVGNDIKVNNDIVIYGNIIEQSSYLENIKSMRLTNLQQFMSAGPNLFTLIKDYNPKNGIDERNGFLGADGNITVKHTSRNETIMFNSDTWVGAIIDDFWSSRRDAITINMPRNTISIINNDTKKIQYYCHFDPLVPNNHTVTDFFVNTTPGNFYWIRSGSTIYHGNDQLLLFGWDNKAYIHGYKSVMFFLDVKDNDPYKWTKQVQFFPDSWYHLQHIGVPKADDNVDGVQDILWGEGVTEGENGLIYVSGLTNYTDKRNNVYIYLTRGKPEMYWNINNKDEIEGWGIKTDNNKPEWIKGLMSIRTVDGKGLGVLIPINTVSKVTNINNKTIEWYKPTFPETISPIYYSDYTNQWCFLSINNKIPYKLNSEQSDKEGSGIFRFATKPGEQITSTYYCGPTMVYKIPYLTNNNNHYNYCLKIHKSLNTYIPTTIKNEIKNQQLQNQQYSNNMLHAINDEVVEFFPEIVASFCNQPVSEHFGDSFGAGVFYTYTPHMFGITVRRGL
jgi:hypothetical protein